MATDYRVVSYSPDVDLMNFGQVGWMDLEDPNRQFFQSVLFFSCSVGVAFAR
jgi:hypothetical protein